MRPILALLLTVPLTAQRSAHPEFVAGDQCLFCHRNDIGPAWGKNRHNLTVTAKEGSTELFTLGSRTVRRNLRKTGYGRFAIEHNSAWDKDRFADRCAGCHTTAVNLPAKTFTEYAIDCYACHGAVNLEHSNDTALILLSKKNRTPPRTVISICGSCHLRGGQSKATGLPYAHHFTPGDDLFPDYRLQQEAPDNAGDGHVWRNVRDVLENNSGTTCLHCHSVHGGTSQKHRRVLTGASCLDCHNESGPKKAVRPYTVRSALCEY